jgi:micrococcal nuclease
LLNKYVDIDSYGNDRYDRTLGGVYVDGKNVNLEMIKAGLAEVYRGKPAPGFDNGPYEKAENEARSAGKGMWSLGDKYVSPRKCRKIKN